jgi:ABC-type glutathione transport system ATPase component
MSAVLKIDALSVDFVGASGPSRAVEHVSLTLEKGEIFGLVGESGSGKSTVANAVMGLLPGSARIGGRVAVNGRETHALKETELQRLRGREMSMVFQDASMSLDPTWSVGEQIAETILAHGELSRAEAKARSIALMDEVGIPDAAKRYRDPPHRLSGGQRQRIVIAAAIANNPSLLVADEPTTALDVTIQAQVLKLIDALRRDYGTTVLLITHDLGVVSELCDRVGVMYRGRLLESGKTAEVFARPEHPYTRALLAANPAWAVRGSRLPVVPKEWSVDDV